ncbi:MAG: alcohol dehydrogenase catalytic domain-containing protein [Pseudomonadales bacterium]|nr:alcohol dehydrogenase catalytic domain-containing protein [Pseudomonadales bacterium]MBP9033788.1 alcohol dehydrogenase catalytic domain-containing protein [Pseudomonadales bacterium]
MRAAVFRGAGAGQVLVIENRPEPVPQAGEVLIKVKRAGICGSDLHLTSGEGIQLATDSIIGHEFAGEVVALGAGVDRIAIGDRLAPMPYVGCGQCPACFAGRAHHCPLARFDIVHGFSEYSRVGARDCARLPDDVSDEEGALIEPLAVGLEAVRKSAMPVGARVLVTGAGPIGLAAAFWAQRLGASRIAVMAASARRRQVALALGATHFIARNDTPDPASAIRDALEGSPDVVLEAVGMSGAIAEAIDFVKPLGTVVSLGFSSGPDTFVPQVALTKEVRLLFSMCYDRQDFQYAADVMGAGDHRPRAMITDTVSLEALPAKFEQLRGPSPDCKVMVAPWNA